MKFPRIQDEPFVIDLETTGLDWRRDQIFGFSVCTYDESTYYYDVRDTPKALDWLNDTLAISGKTNHPWVAHNAKFDAHFMMSAKMDVPLGYLNCDCTMIRAALIDEHLMSYDLDSLGQMYVNVGKDVSLYQKLADIFGGKPTKNAQMGNISRAPVRIVEEYANIDALVAMKLWKWQEAEIETQCLRQVHRLEARLLPVIISMERKGVRVDLDKVESAAKQLEKLIVKRQKELNKIAGFEVNVNPSTSLKKFIVKGHENGQWVARDGTALASTEKGAPKIDKAALSRLKIPGIELVSSIRSMRKTKETFLEGHILKHHHNGRIHANFNQTKSDNELGTGTGRLSCNNPPLQQIHKRDPAVASIVRAMFLPDEEQIWECKDWSQMDFRVFAHYTNEKSILDEYLKDPDADFHQLVAGITDLPRSPRFSGDPNAKQINLGLVFGMGSGKLAAEMGMPYTIEKSRSGKTFMKPGPEAEDIFAKYHSAIPGVRKVLTKAESIAKSRGFVRTVIGRRIRFPNSNFGYKAGGLVFQGSAADALKLKLCQVHEYLQTTNGEARLILNVHDEFDISRAEEAQHVSKEVTNIIEDFGPDNEIFFRVPIRSSSGTGKNWWEASK